ncbi:hypothetical protein HZS_1299 [Henneguya salminicola]|nr:hypothetical protein HZS_1299 [Henneguya salminicola]
MIVGFLLIRFMIQPLLLFFFILAPEKLRTTAIADCFRSYCSLPDALKFVNSITGSCTNRKESTWNNVKTRIEHFLTESNGYNLLRLFHLIILLK